MNKSMGFVVACVALLGACNVEHYDDDCSDAFDDEVDVSVGSGHAGTKASAGHGASGGAAAAGAGTGGANGGSAAAAGTMSSAAGESGGGTPTAPVVTCERERDCAPGYNCNIELGECQPAAEETCGELETELACTHRSDCTPIYGGTNCSCGQDCECHGGEPGCVCESFQFFVCQAAE